MDSPPSPADPNPRPQPNPAPQATPQVVYVQPAGPGPVRRWFSWMGWVAFFFALTVIMGMSTKYAAYFDTSNGVTEKYHSGTQLAADKIAIINVSGVIGASNQKVKNQIDRVKSDDSVKAVVVRVDSPGGTITGSDYILHHLNEMKKEREIPVVISMGGIATSGGYYVSMAVGDDQDTIFAEPTTTTGSIGVIIPHYDLSGLLEKYDVKNDSLVSHPRKQLLSMTSPMSDDDREVLEGYLQDAFTRFKDVVKSGRPAFREDEAALDELATGEIFTANQALANGLVDKLGFVEDAIERAAELADVEDYRVVTYKSQQTIVDALMATQAKSNARGFDLTTLLEMSAPKGYYLFTALPPLVEMAP